MIKKTMIIVLVLFTALLFVSNAVAVPTIHQSITKEKILFKSSILSKDFKKSWFPFANILKVIMSLAKNVAYLSILTLFTYFLIYYNTYFFLFLGILLNEFDYGLGIAFLLAEINAIYYALREILLLLTSPFRNSN